MFRPILIGWGSNPPLKSILVMELTEKEKELIAITLQQNIIRLKGNIMRMRREGKITAVNEHLLREYRQLMAKFE